MSSAASVSFFRASSLLRSTRPVDCSIFFTSSPMRSASRVAQVSATAGVSRVPSSRYMGRPGSSATIWSGSRRVTRAITWLTRGRKSRAMARLKRVWKLATMRSGAAPSNST
jgi:hypothetical protein